LKTLVAGDEVVALGPLPLLHPPEELGDQGGPEYTLEEGIREILRLRGKGGSP